MADGGLERTSMLLSEAHRDALDSLAHSRTAAVRRLLTERDDVDYPEGDPNGRCPECGREVALQVVSDGAMMINGVDLDTIDYCQVDTAASWLYVHGQ